MSQQPWGRYCCYLQFTGWENCAGEGLGNSPQSTPIGKGTLKISDFPDTWVFSFCLKRPADGWTWMGLHPAQRRPAAVVWLLILLTGCSPHCSIISHPLPCADFVTSSTLGEQPWVMLFIKFIWLIWQHPSCGKWSTLERNEVQMPGEGEGKGDRWKV